MSPIRSQTKMHSTSWVVRDSWCQSCQVEGRAFTTRTPVAEVVCTDSEWSSEFGGGRRFWSQTTPGTGWLTAVFQDYFTLSGPTLFCLSKQLGSGALPVVFVPTGWLMRIPSHDSVLPITLLITLLSKESVIVEKTKSQNHGLPKVVCCLVLCPQWHVLGSLKMYILSHVKNSQVISIYSCLLKNN